MSEIRRCNRTVYEGHVKYSRSYLVHMCYMKKADGRTCLWPPEGSVVLHHAHLQEGSLCLWTPSRAAVFVLCAFSSLRWDWSSIHGRISWLIFQSCILDFFQTSRISAAFRRPLFALGSGRSETPCVLSRSQPACVIIVGPWQPRCAACTR